MNRFHQNLLILIYLTSTLSWILCARAIAGEKVHQLFPRHNVIGEVYQVNFAPKMEELRIKSPLAEILASPEYAALNHRPPLSQAKSIGLEPEEFDFLLSEYPTAVRTSRLKKVSDAVIEASRRGSLWNIKVYGFETLKSGVRFHVRSKTLTVDGVEIPIVKNSSTPQWLYHAEHSDKAETDSTESSPYQYKLLRAFFTRDPRSQGQCIFSIVHHEIRGKAVKHNVRTYLRYPCQSD